MRWKTFLLISIVLVSMFILLIPLASAKSEIAITPIKNEIKYSEQASFKLEITNKRNESQRYSIYSLTVGWNVEPSPLKDKIIELEAGESYTTTIIATLLEKLPPSIYNIPLIIESDQGETYNEAMKVYIGPEGPASYLPTVKVNVDMNDKINPKEPVSIKLFIENRNPLNLTDLMIKIQSDIPEFQKEVSVDLPGLEKKTVEFTVIPNEIQQPKEYVLFFVFEYQGEDVKVVEKNFEIVSLLPKFKVASHDENIFLKTFTSLTITNEGNIKNTQTVNYPITFLQSLFVKSNDGQIISDGKNRFLSWEIPLGPNESTTLSYTTDYRLLLYILVIIILLVGFYVYVQSPLSLKKSAVTTQSGENGALSEIKITLDLKNLSKKVIKEVSVTDIVPGIANVEKTLELGTLKPREVKHTKAGTKVIWSLAELDAQEQRLITYKVKAKLNIVGTFSLPRATVEFKKRKGKVKKAYSNIFRLGS